MTFGNINFNKLGGIILLVAFGAVAASVLCLATAQASTMDNCSTPGGNAVCPFMSASVPVIFDTAYSVRQVMGMLIAAFAIIGISLALFGDEKDDSSIYIRELLSGRNLHFANPVLALLSQGILHPRIFNS